MTHAAQPQQFHPQAHADHHKVAGGINFIAGIYLIISCLVDPIGRGYEWNGIIVGIIVAILAASRFSGSARPWASWVNAILGIWLIISPWIYGFAGTGQQWNSIIVGIVVLIIGFWGGAEHTEASPSTVPR